MLRTQSSIALASAALRSGYFRRSPRYPLSDARDESSCHHRSCFLGYGLLCVATSFRGAWLSIAGKWRRLNRKTCRYDSQKESPDAQVRSSEVNSPVCTFKLACPLWRAWNCCDMDPLPLFGRSCFKILTAGSSHFEFSIHVFIERIIYSIEQMRSKISDRRLLSLTAGRISPASIRIRTNAWSSVDRKGHRPCRIATVLASS